MIIVQLDDAIFLTGRVQNLKERFDELAAQEGQSNTETEANKS